jgi:pyruvate dehydrogenase E2 component (dihydrolipoamide acetyltransferase)
MPRLSDSMEEGTILQWLRSSGDPVSEGEDLVEIETDKATMVHATQGEGVLSIVVLEGQTVPVGTVIARLDGGSTPDVGALAEKAEDDVATGDVNNALGQAAAVPANHVDKDIAGATNSGVRVWASPVARRLAAKHSVDIATLVGSGPRGRVVNADVRAAIEEVSRSADPAAASPSSAPYAKGKVTVQELSRTQRLIAQRMSEAKATVPEFTLTVDVDMTAAVELRSQFKEFANGSEPIPSFNDLIVKAFALALAANPRANGSYRDGRFELHDRVNVGIAVAAPDALVVPSIFDADRKSLREIAQATRELARKVREGTITPPELAGGTFTISNLGMYGINRFEAIINPPQGAILAVGAIQSRAVVNDDDEILARPMMTMTLASDHRILYGADAAQFLTQGSGLLEQPLRMVL